MASGKTLNAKEDRRRFLAAGDKVDVTFLVILLLVLPVGLTMLY